MKKKLTYLGATAMALAFTTSNVMAQTTATGDPSLKSILRPLLWSITFAAVGMVKKKVRQKEG